MSQKSEDSIERFFRKGVVQQDKTFMERDWQSMEKMLDDHAMADAAAQAGKSKLVAKASITVLMLSFLFLIGVERETSENNVQMQAAVGALGPRIGVKNEDPAADLHSFQNKKIARSGDKNIAAKKNLNTSKGIAAKKTLRHSKKSAPAQTNIRRGYTGTDKGMQPATQAFSPDEEAEKIPYTKTSESHEINTAPTKELNNDQPIIGDEILPVEMESDTQPMLTSEIAEEKSETQEKQVTDLRDPMEKISDEKSAAKRYPKFNVTALISPDFSTTSLTKYSKPSGVFGMLIGYRISNRFTIMAGATKSLKRYEGYGSEYSPPEGYWQNRTNGVVPDEVRGQCGIVEVPVMIQFDVLQRSKSRMFLSAGVSSYFMRSENYQYTFHQPNPGAANSWTAREPTDYLFKIGHISAGYDRWIGKKFTLGIEPFLKMPFEGIGWTDIHLYSAGAYVNLRYNIISIR